MKSLMDPDGKVNGFDFFEVGVEPLQTNPDPALRGCSLKELMVLRNFTGRSATSHTEAASGNAGSGPPQPEKTP